MDRRLASIVLAAILFLGIFPSSASAGDSGDEPFTSDDLYLNLAFSEEVDDALLLMITSYQKMAEEGEISRIGILMDHYQDQMNKIKSMGLKGQKAESMRAALIQQFEQKLAALNSRQVDLEKAAAQPRRRRRGLFGALLRFGGKVVGGLGRATGKLVGTVGRGTGKLLQLVVEEELPARIKELVMGRLKELGDMFQGKIDRIWQKLADRYGGGFVKWLRGKVDPIFIKFRNSVARKLGLPVSEPEEDGDDQGTLVLDIGPEHLQGRVSWNTFGRETTPEQSACDCVVLAADVTSVSLHLEFDFIEGTVTGRIRDGVLAGGQSGGEEYATGTFSATLGGTVEATADGTWAFQGTALLSLSLEGKAICGRIIYGDSEELVVAEGGMEIGPIHAGFQGGSETQMAPYGGQFHLGWEDDENLDCRNESAVAFDLYNPYTSPLEADFPPVPEE